MPYIPRILIVDDEPQICDSLRLLLARQGYDIFTTTSGREAVDLLSHETFDLLLLDMVIPDMSGFQIMDHINSSEREILTIVITGNASIESAVTALKKGAFDYLKKPFEYEELIKRVGNALQQKKLVHEKRIINGKLERFEERYQFLVQNSPDIIYIVDGRGCFSFINVTVERILGFSADELIGCPFETIVHEESAAQLAGFLKDITGSGARSSLSVELKLKLRDHPDGFKLFEIEHARMGFSPDDEASGTYGVARDITYRRQLENQLRQAKKMEAIGGLAGGIAHDFNNILMGIMGYTSLMLSETDADHVHHAKLQSIEQHVRSGANLTKQLLGFARGRTFDVKPADIHGIIDRTVNMFGRAHKNIAITRSFAEQVSAVEVDEGQIEQVLLNLYVNAMQAMPAGGSISLATECLSVDELHARRSDLRAGDYVAVHVRDTGVGMDDEVLQRVFEPFFTTKDKNGTGLGLASAYGIVANHGGTITVQSRKGDGTVFSVFLPASDRHVEEQTPVEQTLHTGTETLLLVDDEKPMLEVGREILETLGYTVATAGSGQEALDRLDSDSGIDLVICDLVMPGMSGIELCETILKQHPRTRLLVSSGFSRDCESSELLQRDDIGFIQKPFAISELSVTLRDILDRQPAPRLKVL